ncbi:MAG: hypothetical protein H0X17_00425 [Deltaproteobacteria bacterium]|nr:hypothetical protein [Gemmatimonadaceae bacterium]MBA3817330.1 hypothetical protein [Deltaproteobacteria bacterium]
MSELGLGAALYFDHELAADPAPIAALWKRLAKLPLRQWWATAKSSQKPTPLDVDSLVAKIASGETTRAAVESEQLGPDELAAIGRQDVLDALCEFASAVRVKAGILPLARRRAFIERRPRCRLREGALAMLSSGSDLTKAQESRVTDNHYWRTHWGHVIRGPEWGTFLSAAHVVALGDLSKLPVDEVVPLASGGAFVQLTSDPIDVDVQSRQLVELRTTLAPVMPIAR